MTRRILVTDDDPCLLSMYRTLFAKQDDLAVDYAETPSACRTFMASRQYDLALFDIDLNDPSEDGFGLLRALRDASPGTGVLMMSSMDLGDTIDRCLSLGADGFASKNKDFAKVLRAHVGALLARRGGGGRLLSRGRPSAGGGAERRLGRSSSPLDPLLLESVQGSAPCFHSALCANSIFSIALITARLIGNLSASAGVGASMRNAHRPGRKQRHLAAPINRLLRPRRRCPGQALCQWQAASAGGRPSLPLTAAKPKSRQRDGRKE